MRIILTFFINLTPKGKPALTSLHRAVNRFFVTNNVRRYLHSYVYAIFIGNDEF